MIHKRSTALDILLEGLNRFNGAPTSQNMFSCNKGSNIICFSRVIQGSHMTCSSCTLRLTHNCQISFFAGSIRLTKIFNAMNVLLVRVSSQIKRLSGYKLLLYNTFLW